MTTPTTKNTEILELIFHINLTGMTAVLSVSDGIDELLGFKANDFLSGKVTLQSRIHAHDQDIADALFSSEIKPVTDTFNFRLRHADGRIRCVKGQYSKVLDSTSNHVTLELRLQDPKRLWQQQGDQTMMANFKAMMENSDDYIYFKDRNHVITGASQTLVAITAPSEHWTDLIGKTDYDVFPEAYADVYYSLDKQVFAGIHVAHEVQETLDNHGNKGWVDNRKYSIRDQHGEVIGLFGIARDITAHKKYEAELKESEKKLRLSQEGGGVGTWEADLVNHTQVWSENCISLLAFPALSNPTWDSFLAIIHPEDRQNVIDTTRAHIEHGTKHDVEYRVTTASGESRWMRSAGQVECNADGRPVIMRGIVQDINERRQAENNLRIAATAFESQQGMVVTDANSVILRVNQAFTDITAYSSEEVIGQTPRLLNSGHHEPMFYTAMWDSINNAGLWRGEIWNRRKSGEIYPGHLSITAVKDTAGNVTNYVGAFIDITMSKAASEEIKNLAFYDSLTRLPNRRLLVDRLKQALASSARSGRRGALLLLDLDYFKTLNDTLGHDIGDLLLQQVAERLASCVREGDTIARLGGDEFVVLLEGLSEQAVEAATQTEAIGHKLMDTLTQPYQLASYNYYSSTSIGVTLFNDHDHAIDALMKQADIAMYQAKTGGRNALRFYDPMMQEAINARVELERELRKAIEQQQFQLHYQIQVDEYGLALGAEALIRWQHPERGMISPFHFIPLAEEVGLILPIGQWVLDHACAQLKKWGQDVLTRDLTLAVNVSAKQFLQADFVTQVQATIQQHGINPTLLKLELTESLLVSNIQDIIAIMNALKALGIKFSLDDFGTGYSSLQYLKMLPLDQLKIDQSFVRDLATNNSDRTIALTIITMAKSLGLSVIAEGVEMAEQRQFLLDNGCTHYQGYLFSKPVPVAEFEMLLKSS